MYIYIYIYIYVHTPCYNVIEHITCEYVIDVFINSMYSLYIVIEVDCVYSIPSTNLVYTVTYSIH